MPAVIAFAQALRPRRVVDIGVGVGTYGFLLRQVLDIGHERLTPESWQSVIDGVEIFEAYRNPVWDYAYDTVWRADARDFIRTMDRYDLCLFNDVLEHFELEEARELAAIALDKCRALIVTTPNVDMPQGEWGGNEAEMHRSFVTRRHLPCVVSERRTGVTSVYVCARDPQTAGAMKAAALHVPTCRPARLPVLRGRVRRAMRMLLGR
jgi:hypothetical protein